MSEPATPYTATPVTLADGRQVALHEPTAGELRGIKLLDVLQLDAGAHAELIPRLCELTRPEVLALKPRDLMALMTTVVGFFAPSGMDDSPATSTTASN